MTSAQKAKWTVLVVVLAVTGCAGSADQCDPRRVNNLIQSIACGTSGWESNLHEARAELERSRAYYLEEYQRSEEFRQENLRQTGVLNDLKQVVKRLQASIDQYRENVTKLNVKSEAARARRQALTEELLGAESRLQDMKAVIRSDGDVRREFERLNREVSARLRAVESGTRGTLVE